MPMSTGFIFQFPAMNGTRAIIWHVAADDDAEERVAPAPAALWKTLAGATKADPAGKPASTSREVSFIGKREGEKLGFCTSFLLLPGTSRLGTNRYLMYHAGPRMKLSSVVRPALAYHVLGPRSGQQHRCVNIKLECDRLCGNLGAVIARSGP